MDKNYDYSTAGFSPFLTRSIEDTGEVTLAQVEDVPATRELNYDQAPTTGSPSNITRIGNIEIDGVKGRITIYDDNGNEVVWVGDIDG